MSANFYDLLKYAATGIASPEMTHFDKMQALSMAGGKEPQRFVYVTDSDGVYCFDADGVQIIEEV